MNALDKAYKELTQSNKKKQEVRLESNPVVIMHEFKNEVMRFLKQLASIALTHDYRTSITNFPKVQQVEVSKLPKEAFKVVNEIDTSKIEKMISEMKEMSKKDKQVLVKNQVDMSMVETLLESVVRAVEASKKTNDGSTTKDSKELLRAITELKDVMSKDKQMAVTIANFDSFPVALPIASYKNSAGETKQGLVDADNHVQVDVLTMPAVTVDVSAVSTSANQTNGSQKTQIVDAGGEAATVTGGKLDVNASIDTTGLATSANQTTIIGHVDGIEGLLTTIDADTGTIATEVAGLLTDTELRATPVPVSGTVTVTATNLDVQSGGADLATSTQAGAIQTSVELIDDAVYTDGTGTVTKGIAILGQDGTNPQAIKTDASGELQVDVLSMPTTAVTGTFWQATQPVSFTGSTDVATQTTLAAINAKLVTGTDIGDVTINNASGGSAVNIQDGGNTITVDYATTGSGTATGALRVELPTNGTGVIATVGAVTAITNALPAGTNAIGKLAANSGVDIGDVDVTSISAGSNLIGDVGIQPRTTNGLDTFMASGSDGSSILVATAQSVKASAGKVYGYYIYNPESAVTFVHFYNTASGSVTVGTTNPLFTLPIPAGSAANLMSEIGITFGTAITVAATTTAGGNTAPSTGVSATIWFK